MKTKVGHSLIDLNVKTKNSLQKAFILSLSSLFLPVFNR